MYDIERNKQHPVTLSVFEQLTHEYGELQMEQLINELNNAVNTEIIKNKSRYQNDDKGLSLYYDLSKILKSK